MDENPPEPLAYANRPGKPPISALSIISVVIGAISIPLDAALMAGVATGLIGLILGIIGVRRSGERGGRITGTVGIVLSALAMLVGITCGVLIFGNGY